VQVNFGTGRSFVDDGMDELLAEFLVESFENLDQLDQDLLALEQDPANRDVLSSIFRNVHTIKGTCGFLGFDKLQEVTHVGENLLSLLRDEVLRVDEDIASALFALTGAIREMLVRIERDGNEGDADYSALAARLTELQSGPHGLDSAPALGPDGATPADSEVPQRDGETPGADGEGGPGDRFGELLVERGAADAADVTLGLIQQSQGDPRHLGEILVEQGVVEPADVRDHLELQSTMRSSVADSSIRVDVALLDELMNLVGELVLARNQILQLTSAAQSSDTAVTHATQRLNLITTELQTRVMKTRMQPIGNVLTKFPRVVRDLAQELGKQVNVTLEGNDTELDKSIVEAIKDPLTHLVRNAVDHGIEPPDVRLANGKPATGTLSLRAYHEGGQVNIEIADDGAGIDVERVKARAVERGLVTSVQADAMGEREAVNLIFMPGFSTADRVTNVSGRGVGMDVVKTNIEKVGGALDVQQRTGEGTTIRLKIPLTLAIIPALVVTSGGDRFAIPQLNLLELVWLDAENTDERIEYVHGAPVYRLRGEILPLVSLNDELGFGAAGNEGEDKRVDLSETSLNIVVLRAEDRQFGLVVDAINDTEEIVVKPLGAALKSLSVFSGCTIMGDGAVALILDVLGLAQRAGVLSQRQEHRAVESDAVGTASTQRAETRLVVQVGSDARCAIPLDMVHRLEEIEAHTIERAGGREVVQYRGGILPLTSVADVLGYEPAARAEAPLQVVVYESRGRAVGLVVERVLDIVREAATIEPCTSRPGLLGCAVIGGVVTEILDVARIVEDTEDRPAVREVVGTGGA
jgi:two-component system chemotaxis sensor kinase CheA